MSRQWASFILHIIIIVKEFVESVAVCNDLSGKQAHRQVPVDKVIALGSVVGVSVNMLACPRMASGVGSKTFSRYNIFKFNRLHDTGCHVQDLVHGC